MSILKLEVHIYIMLQQIVDTYKYNGISANQGSCSVSNIIIIWLTYIGSMHVCIYTYVRIMYVYKLLT